MSDSTAARGDGGIECVTSDQLRLMCLCTFAASALFSIFLFALGQKPDTSRVENVQTVNVVGTDKTALVEKLARERMEVDGLHSSVQRNASGSSSSGGR